MSVASLDKVERGIAAQHLIDNELFKEVMDGLDAEYHAAWRSARTVDAREDCHRSVKVLEQVLLNIRSVALTGKLEEQELERLRGNVVRPPLNEWKRA